MLFSARIYSEDMQEEEREIPMEELPELPVQDEPSQGEAARETLDDWSFVVSALRLNRPV